MLVASLVYVCVHKIVLCSSNSCGYAACLLALGAGSTYAVEERAAVAYVNTSAMALL